MMIRPKPGMKIRNPVTMQLLPGAWSQVVPNSYWLRRLMDGDVIEQDAKPIDKTTTKEKH